LARSAARGRRHFRPHAIRANAEGRVVALDVTVVRQCWTKGGPLIEDRTFAA